MRKIMGRAVRRGRHWHRALHEPSLSALLVVEALFIFGVVPLVSAGTLPRGVIGAFQVGIALVAVFVVAARWEQVLVAVALVVMLGLSTVETWYRGPGLHLGSLVTVLLFTVVLLGAVGRAVFGAAPVTHHRVRGGMVVYLNLALLFLMAFAVLETCRPGAFGGLATNPRQQFGQLLYFSLVTLTSTGYGDVLPLHPVARSLATLEAVTGQLFIASLFARLINLQVLTATSHDRT